MSSPPTSYNGVDIGFSGTTGNVVEGDYIGVTADGAGPLGNTYSGVAIYGGASGNIIGGTAPGSGDVISANTDEGVYISDLGTTGNIVEGDDIGTDASGMLRPGQLRGRRPHHAGRRERQHDRRDQPQRPRRHLRQLW